MSSSTIAIRSADLGSAVSVSAEIDDTAEATAGRSDPVTGLASATIALDRWRLSLEKARLIRPNVAFEPLPR
jgi:hypothetical protein